MHFLKLPIEDPFLEPAKGHSSEGDVGGVGPLAYQPIPFSQTGNPVMSTVAFLASVVDPRVAAAAAKAALQEFSKMKNEIPPDLINSHLASSEKSLGMEQDDKKEDAMETDQVDKPTEDGVSSTTNDIPKASSQSRPPTHGNIQTAAACAFASAAVKAKHLAAVEERKIKSLVALLVETQMKKLEIKLRHFEELEATMDAERQALELQRQQLINERQTFYKELIKVKHGGIINFPPPPTAELIPATGASQSGPYPATHPYQPVSMSHPGAGGGHMGGGGGPPGHPGGAPGGQPGGQPGGSRGGPPYYNPQHLGGPPTSGGAPPSADHMRQGMAPFAGNPGEMARFMTPQQQKQDGSAPAPGPTEMKTE